MKRMIVAILLSFAIFAGFFSFAVLPVDAVAPAADTSEILSLLAQGGNLSHPRLLADREDFARVRRLVQTDPYMMHWYERLYAYAEEQLEQPLPTYEYPAGSRQLDAISRVTTARVCNMAFVYHVTGDKRFAGRAVQELMAVSNFPDWRAKEYLDMTQLAYGVAIGYDWLYDYMTEVQRIKVRDALYNYAVLPTVTTHRTDWYKTSVGNLNTWCNGMATIAALAVLEDYPQDAALLISDAVTNVQVAMNKLLPMGSYIEAPSYFGPGICYLVQMIDCIESTLGTDFGLSEVEGLRESADYLTKMNAERCSFNYGDCPAAVIVTPSLYWFANRYSRPELAVYERSHQQITISTPDDYLALLWYDPEAVEGMDEYEDHTDALLYSDAYESTATFRSFPEDPRRIFAGIKSGDNSSPHSDLDIGTFVLEALGELWFMDFGSDSYGLPGYFTQAKETDPRWTYYRKRTEGQNTLLMNPGTLGGQVLAAKCQLDAYESGYDGGYATLDMTAAYPDASSVKRGMAMFDNRSRILLVDEIQCKNPTDLYWFAHTKAAVSLSADGKTAELTLKGKTLMAQIISPSNATFSLMEAKPLSTSPNPTGQNANAGVQKLTIHLNAFQNGNIAVVFTPILEESDRSKALPGNSIADFSALLQHCAPGTALTPNKEGIYEIRTAEELIALSQMVNSGTTFSGKTVKLLNDIDLKNRTFTPIGGCTGAEADQGKSFRGIFDGGSHVIKNLFIYEPNSFYVGLFGYVNNGTIKNVGIENGYVFGNRKAAGLVGKANHTSIASCFSKAKVICSGGQAGGLVSCVGGECSITDSYHNGIVRSRGEIAGGIVGFIPANVKVTIRNCYHTGELSDTQGSCGLIGYYGMLADAATTQITVENCYATDSLRGSTTGDKEYVSINNSAVISKEELPSFAINLGSAYMYDCEWENDGYPVLNSQCNLTLPENLHLDSPEELRLLAFLVNSGKNSFQGKTVYLDRDIDLQYREWLPIGGNITDLNGSKVFRGTFDGQGNVIRNLKISPKRYFVGFFGNMSGELRNFGIESGKVNALRIGGSLAGNFSGTMKNCFSRATVSCDIAAGGLIGMAGKVMVANCYHIGKVSAASYSYGGGIVGYFAGGAGGSVVENCYHAGTVTGKNTGGIAGVASSSLTDLTISNCYATDSQTLVDSSLTSYVSGGGCVDSATLVTGETFLGQAYTADPAKGNNGGYPILTAFLYGRAQDATLPQNDQGEYLISTADQLRHLAYRVNVLQETFAGKTLRLCSDIDLEYQEWIPIGGSAPDNVYRTFFKGTFEGDGHRIRNLVISSGNCFVGLFGQLQGAVVRNVGVESGYISGNRSVAAIAGSSTASTVEGCYNRAKVFGTSGVGGIVGMAGSNNKILNCYNMGRISGPDSSGGILGYIAGNTTNVSVTACYNGASAPAGLVGIVNETAKNCTLADSLAIAGPDLVNAPASLTIDRCFMDTPSGISYSLPIFSDAFTQDFFMQNNCYPVLKWENKDHRTEFDSVDGVYLIHDIFDLGLLSYKVRQNTDFTGKTFLMTQDLDLEYRPFFPIGGQYEGESFAFRGTFDGGGHRISGLLSHSRTVDNEFTALFGRTENATIRNLGIIDSRINNGVNTAGGIVAYATSTKIENSFNRGSVRNLGNYVGGIVGRVVGNCALENVYCTGSVAGGPASHGGLIGFVGTDVTSLVLKNCYVYCRLIATDIAGCGAYMGYLQGAVSTSKIELENCYYGGKADATSDRLTAKQRQHISPLYYTAEEMKEAYAYLGTAYAKDSAMVNRGFPILQWEQSQNCEHTNVAVENLLKIRRILCMDCGLIREEYQIYTGSCGADLVWTLYAETGLFTVTGTGDMTEYVYNNHAPWEVYASLITKLQISEGCTSIGSFTFYGCRELTDISIPKTVTRIGTSAFYDCRALETVVLPERLTLIGDSAFSNCQNLRSINIPQGVTRIGTFGFYNCYNLSGIIIPSSVQSIGHSAFYNCDGLTEITLPNGVTELEERTFYDCDGLTGVTLPQGLKTLGDYCFSSCQNLTSITLPYGLETISDHAFYYSSLIGVSIPRSVTSIGDCAFCNSTDLSYIAVFNPDCEIFNDKNTLGVSTKTVIYGWKNSTAQTYAETYGYVFKELHQDLYFGFGNTKEDQARYDSYTYGFTNFDLASTNPWYLIGANRGDALYENGKLVLTGKALGESAWPAICLDTAIGGASETSSNTANAYPMNYDPRYAEFIQIRYRMENFVKGEYLNKDTGKMVSVHPYLTVSFSDAEGLKTSVTDRVQIASYISNDDFVVVTLPVSEEMRSMNMVGRLRLYFGGVESVNNDTPGVLTVDYIYVGTEDSLPTAVHAVRFMNYDGTVLQDTVYVPTEGSAMYYHASVPTRKADDTGHYTFWDWTTPLEDVQQDTEFVARYKVEAHTFNYINVNSESHKATCSCGYAKALFHSWDGGQVTTESTCTVPGVRTYICTDCETKMTEPIAATGHTEIIDKAVAPTCTATGLTAGSHCSVCSVILTAQKVIPANGHAEVIDKAVAATCTTSGKTEGKHCSVCNAVLVAQKVIPAKGHTEVIDKAVAATCTATGKTEGKHCSVCNEVLTAQEVIPAKGHTEVIDKAVAATCTATGLTEGKHCSVCSAVLTAQEVIPAKGHTEVIDKIVAPTCTEQGYTIYACSHCGYSYKDDYTEATGHSYLLSPVDEMQHKRSCSKCSATDTENHQFTYTAIDNNIKHERSCSCGYTDQAEGHRYSFSTHSAEQHIRTCKTCGFTDQVNHHFIYTSTGETYHERYCKWCSYGDTVNHSSVIDKAEAATCTATGLTEGKHCDVCGEVITAQEVVPATGHTEIIDKSVAPTCTETGLTEGKHCSVCNEVLTAQEVVPANGHTEIVDKAVAPTCTATGLTEGKHCSVCGEVLTAQEIVPATGHTPVYTGKDDKTHIITCENCDFTEEAPHSYEDGTCVCGHVEVKEPIEESTWKLGHSLNLASDISINYAIGRSILAGYDLDSVYILAEIDSYKEGKYSVKEVKLLPVVNGSYYYFTLTGLTAVNMNDEIRAVLYGTKDGQVHYSPIDTYSVATYAYAQLPKASAPQKLKVLCAELLRYGAKAQIFKSYRLDALVDAKMTEEQKALLSDMEAVTFGNMNLTENIPATNSITWLGKSLDLASKVSVKFIFSLGSYTGSTEDLTMKVTYKDVNGKDKEKIITDLEIYNASHGYYAFTLDSLLAAELRSVLTVQIMSGDTVVSGTLQYAADTYGNGKTGTLGDLCKALFAYSDSAKAYFQ